MSRLILPDAASPAQMSDDWVREYAENRWLGLGDTTKIEVANPFDLRTQFDIENPHIHLLDLMRRPEYFGYTVRTLFGKTLAPFQLAILQELWHRPFPMLIGSRGMGKSWILAMYCMLRALFDQGSKIIIVGAAFRQAKVVFDYCQDLWENAPVLQDIVGDGKKNGPRRDVDRCSLRMGDSIIIALPLGDGTKIRGQRANIIIGDEFASIPKDIFETVVRGFAAVSLSPVDQFRSEMKKVALKELGRWSDAHDALSEAKMSSNQTVISGTAYYSFNHFYEYWKRYKAIIESRGDPHKVAEIFHGEVPEGFDWKDYSVIRVPVQALPPRFMDQKSIAQAKATIHIGTYQMEYGAVFAADSNGFYKRSLIESCVVGKPGSPITTASCGEVNFSAVLRGAPNRQYVMAIDPASEQDNFSVVVLECWPDHRRIVHCWTTTRSRYKAKLKNGLTDANDFYTYTARKIRDLMRLFPCERIAIDSQGGGVAVIEALQDKDRLAEGEQPLYPVVDPEEPKDTDAMSGLHILDVVNFAKYEWVRDANNGMRKDLEDKVLLFPEFDPMTSYLALKDDKDSGRVKVDTTGRTDALYDTLDDCVKEIEDLKDELATIEIRPAGVSGRERWDTPETKQAGGKRGRMRKDRYSALLMANMTARVMMRTPKQGQYRARGGFVHDISRASQSRERAPVGPMYVGPAWYTEAVASQAASGGYGAVAKRRH